MHPSSAAGKVGQLVADVPGGLSLIPPHESKKKKKKLPTSRRTTDYRSRNVPLFKCEGLSTIRLLTLKNIAAN
jgi:hypothetical protein